MFWFGPKWEEVYLGQNLQELYRKLSLLDLHRIQYKTLQNGNRPLAPVHHGCRKTNQPSVSLYRILVKKDEAPKARYLLYDKNQRH